VTNTTPLNERGGFYCEDCQCLLKDSSSYLDHINGKKRACGGGQWRAVG
jgi:U4/U6.U5 tri-snRNP component SNU23